MIEEYERRTVVFAYSDVAHETVMHAASRTLACWRRLHAPRPGPDDDPEHPAGARRRGDPDRRRQEPDDALPRRDPGRARDHARSSSATRCRTATSSRSGSQRFATLRRPRPVRHDDRGARGVRAPPRRRPDRLRRRRLRGDPAPGRGARPTSSSGTAATTTSRSTGPTSSSSSPTRCGPGDERRYHPGETNLRMADVVVINKIDSADARGDRGGPRTRSPS